MTFRFSSGRVVETGDAYDPKTTRTQFAVTGDAGGCVVFHVAWKEGRGQRQVNVRVRAQTILAIADAIRCCPEHICEDPRTGAKGAAHPPTWIGHAIWHLDHPEAVRPCLDAGTRIIDAVALEAAAQLPGGRSDPDEGPCRHEQTRPGRDIPRVWGSFASQVCARCGAFRQYGHGVDPDAPGPGDTVSDWRPASDYEDATAERGDE